MPAENACHRPERVVDQHHRSTDSGAQSSTRIRPTSAPSEWSPKTTGVDHLSRTLRSDSYEAHHSFISTLRRRQVVEKWCRCGGSIESNSVVRDSLREE